MLVSLGSPLVLFVCAGKIQYYEAWVLMAVNLVTALMNYFSIKDRPALMTEGLQPGANAKAWDKHLLKMAALVYFLTLIVAGLDSGRYQWSPVFHPALALLGAAIMIGGQIVFLYARHQNNFFSTIVRIQTDRNHVVCDKGLYSFVRHPGYLGVLISLLGLPLVTASLWSMLPVVVSAVLLLFRTNMEDKALQQELPGYLAYTQKTRYRLFPGIW